MFVASKSGIINVFDSLDDTTPTQFADLRTRVHDFWDRGLLGLALDPGFTSGRPYVYVALRLRQGAELDAAAALGRRLPVAAGRRPTTAA